MARSSTGWPAALSQREPAFLLQREHFGPVDLVAFSGQFEYFVFVLHPFAHAQDLRGGEEVARRRRPPTPWDI